MTKNQVEMNSSVEKTPKNNVVRFLSIFSAVLVASGSAFYFGFTKSMDFMDKQIAAKKADAVEKTVVDQNGSVLNAHVTQSRVMERLCEDTVPKYYIPLGTTKVKPVIYDPESSDLVKRFDRWFDASFYNQPPAKEASMAHSYYQNLLHLQSVLKKHYKNQMILSNVPANSKGSRERD